MILEDDIGAGVKSHGAKEIEGPSIQDHETSTPVRNNHMEKCIILCCYRL